MSRRPAMPMDYDGNQYAADYDRIAAERPPEITWRLNRRGIWVAVSVREWTPERVNRPSSRRSDATHCGKGHELTEDNTYVSPAGYRQCRICKLVTQEKARANRRAARMRQVIAEVGEILAARGRET